MLKAGLILSLALLAGRIAGLLREVMLASVFGVSADADVAVLLLTVPDLFVNLLVSGGLSAALVPHLATLQPPDALALFRHASIAAIGLFSLIGLGLAAWPQALFQVLAPGLVTPLTAWTPGVVAVAIAIPLTGAAGVAGAYLNAGQRFFVTGCGTLFFNLGVLGALWLGRDTSVPLQLLAYGIVAGAGLRWGAQLVSLPRPCSATRTTTTLADRALLRAFGAAVVATSLLLLAPLFIRAMASTLGPGAIASFNFAQKLIELPVGILITSISTVALARMSALYARGEHAAVAQAALRDTQHALLMAVAVALLGAWFADAVVQTVYGRGAIGPAAQERIAGLTRIALLGVPFIAISSMATARLYAAKQASRILAPTVVTLLLLPLFALPGLVWQSELALMGAVVLFQAVVALWLGRLAGLRCSGGGAVLDGPTCRFLLLIVCFAAMAGALDWIIAVQSHWLRLLLAGAGFGAALLTARRFLHGRGALALEAA